MDIKDLITEEAIEEQYTINNKMVIVRRDDFRFKAPLPPNMKMEALFEIVKHAYVMGYKKVVMFAKKQQGTSYVIGLPVFCEMFNMEAIITYPMSDNGPLPDWIFQMRPLHGKHIPVDIRRLHPNMVTINVNQSKKIAEAEEAYFIPFGFDSPLSVEAHARSFRPKVDHIGTLITATMTGMILAGILKAFQQYHYGAEKVIGISGGRPPANIVQSMNKYLDEYITSEMIKSGWLTIYNPYDRNIDALELIKFYNDYTKQDRPDFFHPDYEAKAWLWMLQNIETLKEPIYFVNVGR